MNCLQAAQPRRCAAPHAHARTAPPQQARASKRGERCFRCRVAAEGKGNTAELRSALAGSVSSEFQLGSAFLKELGFENPAEIARILDIAMNPDSIFVSFKDKKLSKNDNARPLTVEDDIRPVVDYLRSEGLQKEQIVKVIKGHPPILSYSADERLKPLFDYLGSIGFADRNDIIVERPSLSGLDVENNIKRIVDYLEARDYPREEIATYLKKTL